MKTLIKYDQVDASAGGANPNPATPPPAAPAAPVAAPATPLSTQTQNWYDGMRDDVKNFVINREFKNPEMLADSYINLEKLKGAPADKLVRLPDAPDAPEWNNVYERLGKPKDAEGYGLEEPKDPGVQKDFVDWAKKAFLDSNLTKKQADALLGEWNKFNENLTTKESEAARVQADQSVNELKTAWGNAYDKNLNIAQAGAKQFGATAQAIEAMEKSMGTKATMEFFRNIGSKLGEAAFVQGDGTGAGHMSVDSAQAAISQYTKDSSFMKKYTSGDAAAVKTMNSLFADAYPGSTPV